MTDKLTYEEAVETEEFEERVEAIIELLESQGYGSVRDALPVIGAIATSLLIASYEADDLFSGSEYWIDTLRNTLKPPA